MSCAAIANTAAIAGVRSPATSTLRRSGKRNSLASSKKEFIHRHSRRSAVAVSAASSSEELPPTAEEWAKEWRAALPTDALQEFMTAACKRLDGVDARFICIGDGGILESVNPFPSEPRFAELGAKGTCCTLASPNKNFEAHLFLAKVGEVALARSERGGRKIYAVRFFGKGEGGAAGAGAGAGAEGAAPARPMLTVVLHGGEDGAVPKAAVDKWESLSEFLC